MADADIRMIRDCLVAVRLRVGQAETRVARAIDDVARAADGVQAAETAIVDAEDDWHRQMRDGFDPTIGTLLARSVLACVETARAADDRKVAVDRAHTMAMGNWHREDARCRALEQAATSAGRRYRHRRDERDLAVLADRETLKWIRK